MVRASRAEGYPRPLPTPPAIALLRSAFAFRRRIWCWVQGGKGKRRTRQTYLAKNGQGFRGGAQYRKKIDRSWAMLGGHGGAVVVVVVAAVLLCEEGIKSPSYHLGDGWGGSGRSQGDGRLVVGGVVNRKGRCEGEGLRIARDRKRGRSWDGRSEIGEGSSGGDGCLPIRSCMTR
jgi:hypothetical protein